jgi:hypothetical protein
MTRRFGRLFAYNGKQGALTRRRKMAEYFDHLFVNRPLERNDQFGELDDRLPSPGIEFRPLTAGGVSISISLSSPSKRSANHF